MTPEQSEQWQQAVSALDYRDAHAITPQGLQETYKRLEEWGVPGWAAYLRLCLLARPSHRGSPPWQLSFALRSEVALIGLRVLSPDLLTVRNQFPHWLERYDRAELRQLIANDDSAYDRVFLGFVPEALRPILAWARQSPDLRERDGYTYEPLIALCALCARYQTPRTPQEHSEIEQDWKELYDSQLSRPNTASRHDTNEAYTLAQDLLRYIGELLGMDGLPPSVFGQFETALYNFVRSIDRLHQWRLKGGTGSDYPNDGDYHALIAAAYLAALEAECPPPDWLELKRKTNTRMD